MEPTIENIISYLWDTQTYMEDINDIRILARSVWGMASGDDLSHTEIDEILETIRLGYEDEEF
jgi:hypothetical protein